VVNGPGTSLIGGGMKITKLKKNWEIFGKTDALWSVLTAPGKEGNKWKPDEFFETGRKEIDDTLAYLSSLGFSVNRGNALDFGCGVGRLTQAMAEHFQRVCGVDISEAMIEKAESFNRFGDVCRYCINTEDNLPAFNNEEFDFVYSNIVLQHMKPVYSKKYIVEFGRVLKKGGLLVFQLPSGRKRQSGFFRNLLRRIAPESLIDWLFHARIRLHSWLDGKPLMEMYSVNKKEVTKLFSNCEILAIQDNNDGAASWISTKYFVRKSA